MMYLRRSMRPMAIAAALSVALTACGGGDDAPPTETETTPATGTDTDPAETETDAMEDMEGASGNPFVDLKAAADHVGYTGSAKALASGVAQAAGLEGDIDAPAVQLYAQLATLLQEHVYLAGTAIDVALITGTEDPRFAAAADALDVNSVELADVIGSAAPDQRDAFLALWREHIGFFVEYTLAAAAGDEDEKAAVIEKLDAYRGQAGAFFETLTGGALPADAVADSLGGHVDTLTTAIDSGVAADTSVFDELKAAASHVGVDGSAKALAGGFAQALGLEGDLDAPATGAYLALSTELEEHVYLAGLAVITAYAAGPESDAFAASAATLDANSVEIADIVGSVVPDQRDAFLALWREHIGFFVDYALGAAAGDDAMKQTALDNLDGYRGQAGAFFEDITGGALPADAVADSLSGHIDTLATTIDGAAAAFAG
jgi:hypothetical protein